MAHVLETTVWLDEVQYLAGQTVDGDIEEALAKTWGDRDDLWTEVVVEEKPKPAPRKAAADKDDSAK